MPIGISMQTVPTYRLSAFRKFLPGERHITRVESGDILLLMLDGVLRFTEDGVPVELTRGEYYIQERGLLQEGPEVSDSPYYFYLHFGAVSGTMKPPTSPDGADSIPRSFFPFCGS